MRPFRYEHPGDVPSALGMLAAAPDGAFLAGGTNLIDLMRLGVAKPDVLVDVRRLTSNRVEDLPDGGVRIGASVTNSDLAAHRTIRRRYPMLSQALLSGAFSLEKPIGASTAWAARGSTRCGIVSNH